LINGLSIQKEKGQNAPATLSVRFACPNGASLISGAGKRGLMARYALVGVAMP